MTLARTRAAFARGDFDETLTLAVRDAAELLCDSPASMIDTAVDVANDTARKQRLGAAIRANLPALTQSEAPLRALDDTLTALLETR